MADGWRWTLAAKPVVAAAMAGGDPALVGWVHRRIEGWLRDRGYAPAGVAVRGDGTVLVDCDRDPGPEWGAFDPSVKTAAETQRIGERAQVAAMLAKLNAGTATTREAQKVLAVVALWVLATEREG